MDASSRGEKPGAGITEFRPSAPSEDLPPALQGLRVALVHDWLTGMRGGEKCLEVLCRAFPRAALYTLIHRKGSTEPGYRVDDDPDLAASGRAGRVPPLPAPAAADARWRPAAGSSRTSTWS